MSKLSTQEEQELILFIKDWLKVHGYSQKDLAKQLNLNSSRTSEIANKINDLYKKGGIINIAKSLIKIEQYWINNKIQNNKTLSKPDKKEDKPYNQLGLDYKLDIDQLMDQMEKDHKNN